MSDTKLCRIDIPKARTQILKSIAEYQRHALLASTFELFLKELQGKRIDSRAASKLQTKLQDEAPALKVYRVTFHKTNAILSSRPEYTFKVWMYDIEQAERTFTVRTKDDGSLDIDAALIADRKWLAHAAFLEERLKNFAYHAGKFNEAVETLQKYASLAVAPDDHYPVYPLSDFFHWYKLQ